jgi:enoyl-CoA hydratase/carnithine racemase
MDQPTQLSFEGGIATVTLCNPAKRNALSLDVLEALTEHFVAVGESDAVGVILAAEGPVFSAGHNFGEMAGTSFQPDADHASNSATNCCEGACIGNSSRVSISSHM